MPVQRVAVVGGGIGGLTTALALHDRGFAVAVFEQDRHLTETGAGLQVAPNAGRVLHHLGLGAALATSGDEAGITTMRHGRTGDILRVVSHATLRERHGLPQYRPHRADLQAMLAEALARRDPTALRLGRRLAAATPGPDGVELRFEDGQQIGRTCSSQRTGSARRCGMSCSRLGARSALPVTPLGVA